MALRVRGFALPHGDPVDLYADGDRWTTDPVGGAELVARGWLLPGLVDAHTHPGTAEQGQPLDEKLLREHLRAHLDAGVTLIRSPGLAADPPEWFGKDEDGPRAFHAGPWIAGVGPFIEGWGRRPGLERLAEVAAEQAGRTGWAKLIVDWDTSDGAVPVEVLREVVARVHAAGGRVAVHSQQAEGGRVAVESGVDSLEHGMCLDPQLLSRMAEQGTALTPTLALISRTLETVWDKPEGPRKTWYVGGASAHPALTAAAFEAGSPCWPAPTRGRTGVSPTRSVPLPPPGWRRTRRWPPRRGRRARTSVWAVWRRARPPTLSSSTRTRAPICRSWTLPVP
ncbi:MAG TPA: hypothetical protein VF062_29510 [Candidatus Limnocylindrales bacterium]